MSMSDNGDTGKPTDAEATQDSKSENNDLQRFREEILSSEPEVIVANHCFGLFELAAIYLSENPPRLAPASLAIDALSGLTESIKGRLGGYEQEISDGIAQLRLAFVQVSALANKPAEEKQD